MWSTQKMILPLFFVLLSFSTRATFARENRNIVNTVSENVYDLADGKEFLRDKRENVKLDDAIETIDASTPQINKEVAEDGYESTVHTRREVENQIPDGEPKQEGEYKIELSGDAVRPIEKDNEELTLEEERIAVLRHLEDLISKVSTLAERANLAKENSDNAVPSPISTSTAIIEREGKEEEKENLYEDDEPVHDKRQDGERNRLPKRHLISADRSSLVASAASAASAAASGTAPSASSAAASASSSSSSFVLPTPLPLQILEELSCAVESVEHGHSHVLGIIVHEVLCEARKLWHYLLHALHNLKSEISLGPQINLAEAYAGASSFSGFLERSPVILEELLKEPRHLLALPEIVKGAVPLESIFNTLHRLKHSLHKLLGVLQTVIREKLHHGLHKKITELEELGLLEKLLPLEEISSVSSAVTSASASASASSSETLINYLQSAPLNRNLDKTQEILHAAKAVYDAYHASRFNEVLRSGNSASSSASSAASSGSSTVSSSASSSAASTSHPAPALPVIPLSSETTVASAATATTTNTETVEIERPVPSLPLESPATISTTSTATSTVVASEPEILVERPTIIETPLSSTTVTSSSSSSSGAISNLDSSDVVSSSSASSSSSANLLSRPQLLESFRPLISSVTPLLSPISSGSSSSSSSAASVASSSPVSQVAPVETVDTVTSAAASSSSSSVVSEPIGFSQIRPILSELSSKVKAQSSASVAAIASVIEHNKQHHSHEHGHHSHEHGHHSHEHDRHYKHGHHKGVTSSVVSSPASSSASSSSSSGGKLQSRPRLVLSPLSLSNVASSSSSSAASSSSNNVPASPLINIDSASASSASSASSGSTNPVVLAGRNFIRPVLSTVVPLVETSEVSSAASSSASSSSNDVPVSPIIRLRNFGKSFIPNVAPLTSVDSSSASSSSSASGSSSPVVLAGQRILNPVLSTVVPYVESTQSSSAASSAASSSSNDGPLTNIDSASSSSSSGASSSSNPVVQAGQQVLRRVFPTVVPFVEPTQVNSAAASSAASSSSSPSSSTAASSAASSALSSSPWRLRLPVILPREKVVAAIGNNGPAPGDVVVITLKSRKSLYARIVDTVSPITFSLLRPRAASSIFQNAGTVWNLSPRDFNDISCENLFDGIY